MVGGSSLVTAPGEQGGFWEEEKSPEVVRSIGELTTHEAGCSGGVLPFLTSHHLWAGQVSWHCGQ